MPDFQGLEVPGNVRAPCRATKCPKRRRPSSPGRRGAGDFARRAHERCQAFQRLGPEAPPPLSPPGGRAKPSQSASYRPPSGRREGKERGGWVGPPTRGGSPWQQLCALPGERSADLSSPGGRTEVASDFSHWRWMRSRSNRAARPGTLVTRPIFATSRPRGAALCPGRASFRMCWSFGGSMEVCYIGVTPRWAGAASDNENCSMRSNDPSSCKLMAGAHWAAASASIVCAQASFSPLGELPGHADPLDLLV